MRQDLPLLSNFCATEEATAQKQRDAEARRKGLTTAARHIRRQETARTLLDDIHSKIEAAQSCRRLQVPVPRLPSTILPGLADLQIRCLRDLTPAVWVTWHS